MDAFVALVASTHGIRSWVDLAWVIVALALVPLVIGIVAFALVRYRRRVRDRPRT